MTGACTTREAVTASIKDTLDNLGGKRWNGDLVQDQAYKLKSAYTLEAEPESASAPQPKSEAGQAPEESSGARKGECQYWPQRGGCYKEVCQYRHPNGKRFKNPPICHAWRDDPKGCTASRCDFTSNHPNGKKKKDAESPGDAEFNKRDLTPVGKRHTPVDKGEPVKVDPKAAEAHARNHNKTRVRVRDPQSD